MPVGVFAFPPAAPPSSPSPAIAPPPVSFLLQPNQLTSLCLQFRLVPVGSLIQSIGFGTLCRAVSAGVFSNSGKMPPLLGSSWPGCHRAPLSSTFAWLASWDHGEAHPRACCPFSLAGEPVHARRHRMNSGSRCFLSSRATSASPPLQVLALASW